MIGYVLKVDWCCQLGASACLLSDIPQPVSSQLWHMTDVLKVPSVAVCFWAESKTGKKVSFSATSGYSLWKPTPAKEMH